MANKAIGEVDVVVPVEGEEDRTYTLRPTFRAIQETEQAMGSILAAAREIEDFINQDAVERKLTIKVSEILVTLRACAKYTGSKINVEKMTAQIMAAGTTNFAIPCYYLWSFMVSGQTFEDEPTDDDQAGGNGEFNQGNAGGPAEA